MAENRNPLKITDTFLRDAHQSLAATRMTTEEMLPICELLDQVGYWSLECWGGATFDSCMRYLDEDPWERLRALKKALPNTKLQMLLRGQNILGYRNYADDTVDLFCKKSIENGIDVVRIFDALNDVRNLQKSMECVKRYGGIVEAAISYTTSPVHNLQYFAELAMKLEEMGADVIAIKDMANLLLPYDAYKLVKELKSHLGIPVHLHTHNTSGIGDMTNLMAAQAGVDIVDCALSPMASGTSQPATESMVATLKGTDRDTGLDLKALNKAAEKARGIAERLEKDGFIHSTSLKVDGKALTYQVPGGMLSNLISQLEGLGASDRYYEVLEEVPRVRADFGYPPLVTPTSQIVGVQAVMNVLFGRYERVQRESKALLRGEYGALPGKVDPELRRKIIGDDEVIECRPADLIEPELEKVKEEAGDLIHSEEELLSYAIFPQVAEEFLNRKYHPEPESPVEGLTEEEVYAAVTAAITQFNFDSGMMQKSINLLVRNWSR